MIEIPLFGDCRNNRLPVYPVWTMPSMHLERNVFLYHNMILNENILEQQAAFFRFLFKISLNKTQFLHKFFRLAQNIPIIYLKGHHLLATHPYFENYSHFTLNCLSTLLIARYYKLINRDLHIIINLTKKFHQELLAYHNLNIDNQILTADPEKLYCLENCYYCDATFNSIYSSPEMFDLFINDNSNTSNNESRYNLYITRKNNPYRSALNEDEVIRYLTECDFRIESFDNIPVERQIALIQGANTICAPHGASGANFVYIGTGTKKVIEFFPENHLFSGHTSILMGKDLAYSGTVNRCVRDGHDAPYTVNMVALEQALKGQSARFHRPAAKCQSSRELLQLVAQKNLIEDPGQDTDVHELVKSAQYARALDAIYTQLHPKLISELIRILHLLGYHKKCITWLRILYAKLMPDRFYYGYLVASLIKSRLLEQAHAELEKIPDQEDSTKHSLLALCALAEQPTQILLGIFNKTLYFDPDTNTLTQNLLPDTLPLQMRIVRAGISLWEPGSRRYIADCTQNGSVSFSSAPAYISAQFISPRAFTINFKQGFLSARRDGSISLQSIANEWEIFQVI